MRSIQGHSGVGLIDANCTTTSKDPTDGLITFNHLGSTLDFRSFSEGGLVAGGLGTQQGRQTCFLTVVDPVSIPILTPRVEEGKPKMLLYTLLWRRAHNAVRWLVPKLAQDKRLIFWQSMSNAINLYESVPADCLVKVVRRKLDDTEAELLYQKRAPQLKEAPLIVLKETPLLGTARRDPLRGVPVSLVSKIDPRLDGLPQAVVDKDQDFQELDQQPHSSRL